jgi:hypothetical protein
VFALIIYSAALLPYLFCYYTLPMLWVICYYAPLIPQGCPPYAVVKWLL